MVYQVPASKKSVKQNRFEFAVGKKSFEIPLLKFAPVEAAEQFELGHQVSAVIACCETEEAKAAIRSLDSDQFEALLAAWGDESGIDVGESSASSDS